VLLSIVDSMCKGVPYLAVIQEKTETSGDRLEGNKGVHRFLDPAKDKFGARGCERLNVGKGNPRPLRVRISN
jgi:hypothetical protein